MCEVKWDTGNSDILFDNDLISETDYICLRVYGNSVQAAVAHIAASVPFNPCAEIPISITVKMASDKPKCICGAHAVKDAGHSDWCEIK
jgi:hypothetical protein